MGSGPLCNRSYYCTWTSVHLFICRFLMTIIETNIVMFIGGQGFLKEFLKYLFSNTFPCTGKSYILHNFNLLSIFLYICLHQVIGFTSCMWQVVSGLYQLLLDHLVSS